MQIVPWLLIAFSSHSQFIKDSTIFYTLKENEVMVQMGEHQFMHFSKGDEYVFATYTRGVGDFVRTSGGRAYGPYTDLEGTHVRDGVWQVFKGSKVYLLNIATGVETGPFNYLNARNFELDWSRARITPTVVALEPLVINGKNVLNVNGKLFPTGVPENDTTAFSVEGLKRYGDQWFVVYEWYRPYTNSPQHKKDSAAVLKDVSPQATPEVERKIRKNYDSLFVDGKFYDLVTPISSSDSRFAEGYQEELGSLFHTKQTGDSMVFYRDRVPVLKTIYQEYATAYLSYRGTLEFSVDKKYYSYLLTADTVVDALSYYTQLSASQHDIAEENAGKILINNQQVGTGYHLTYDAVKNRFVWISVHGRTLYLNYYTCRK